MKEVWDMLGLIKPFEAVTLRLCKIAMAFHWFLLVYSLNEQSVKRWTAELLLTQYSKIINNTVYMSLKRKRELFGAQSLSHFESVIRIMSEKYPCITKPILHLRETDLWQWLTNTFLWLKQITWSRHVELKGKASCFTLGYVADVRMFLALSNLVL